MKGALLTVDEVANRLKCHPHTVRRWIWGRKLSAVKVGDLVRVPQQELAKLVQPARRTTKPRKKARQKGATALIATIRKLRRKIQTSDVEEMERLIAQAQEPADWSDPLA